MRNRVIALAAMALLAFGAMGAGQNPVDMSTGGLEYHSLATGADVKVAFNARGEVNDASGRVNVRGHYDWNTGTVADFKGDVTCYNRTGDDSATFTGEMSHFTGEGPQGYFRVTVLDGGQDGEDLITANRSDAPFDCEAPHTANNTLTKGNLVVHHD